MDALETSVLKTIEEEGLLQGESRVLAAVSGGPDSVALLLVLQALEQRLPVSVGAAHVNYGLRGKESDLDEEFVRSLCQAGGIPLKVKRVAGAGPPPGQNLQDWARRLRYNFLFETAAPLEAVVATGHILNDQIETFLLKLCRGAGPTGLSGIHPRRINPPRGKEGWRPVVIRPLLECRRSQILSYLERKGQGYRLDATNLQQDFDRNWVRQELLPLLETRLNPNLIHTLGKTARLFREIQDYLAGKAGEALAAGVVRKGSEVRLAIPRLEALPAILRKEVIRQVLRQLRGDLTGITLTHVGAVLQLVRAPSGREIHLPGGWRVRREFDRLLFTARAPTPLFSRLLTVPGRILVKEVGKRVEARRVSAGEEVRGGVRLAVKEGPLMVRNRRPGDRYRLQPGGPLRRVKELLMARRIPRSLRERLLFVESEGRLAWIEGFAVSADFHPGPGLEAVVGLWIEPLDETLGTEVVLKE